MSMDKKTAAAFRTYRIALKTLCYLYDAIHETDEVGDIEYRNRLTKALFDATSVIRPVCKEMGRITETTK